MYDVDSGLSCDVDLELCLKAVSCDVLLTSDSLADEISVKAFGILWVRPQKFSPWRSGPNAYWGFCRSLIMKNPAGMELLLWRLSWNFKRTDGGLDLAMEDKGTPHAMGGSSSPMTARTATWVPRHTWHWVLLCMGDVTVCCSYCCCMLLDPRISITRQGNIAEDGLHVDGEARDREGAECGEINKMMPVRLSHPTLSCSLVPCSVNSGWEHL